MAGAFFMGFGGFAAVLFTIDALASETAPNTLARLCGIALGLGAMFIGARLL